MFAPAVCARISLLQETVMFRELSPSTCLMRIPIFDAVATRPFDMTRGQRAQCRLSEGSSIMRDRTQGSFPTPPVGMSFRMPSLAGHRRQKSLSPKGRPGNDPRHGAVVKRARWIAIVSHIDPSNSVFVDAPKRVPLCSQRRRTDMFPCRLISPNLVRFAQAPKAQEKLFAHRPYPYSHREAEEGDMCLPLRNKAGRDTGRLKTGLYAVDH